MFLLRYEEYHVVGEVSKTREFEGTPEEIAQLISLTEKAEPTPLPKITGSNIDNLSYQEKQDLLKYAHLAFRYFGISLSELLQMDKSTVDWLYIFVDKTIRKEKGEQEKQKKAVINSSPSITINSDSNPTAIANAVKKALDEAWERLLGLYGGSNELGIWSFEQPVTADNQDLIKVAPDKFYDHKVRD